MSSIIRRRRGLISAIVNSCLMRWFSNQTLSDRRPRPQPIPTAKRFRSIRTILTRHPDRMAAFLRKAGVVDDPGFDRAAAFDERQGQLLYPAENPLVGPRRIGDE